MATITYGAVLKVIRVIERAGIDSAWPDFLRAYDLPRELEPEPRPSAGYGAETIEDRRMRRLKEWHGRVERPQVKQLFETLVESVLAELHEPGHDHLGRRDNFWDDDEVAVYDLSSLMREIEQGGYPGADGNRSAMEGSWSHECGPKREMSALQTKVGETVRLFVGNAGPNLPLSFHAIGEIFDRVYPEAAIGRAPLTNVQTTLIPAGGAVIVEMRLDAPGTYLLVDHSIFRIDKGAVGQLVVTGPNTPEVFQPSKR